MESKSIKEYQPFGKIRVRRGIWPFRRIIDPSDEMELEVERFLRKEKDRFNQIVSNTFDVDMESMQKYEFFFVPSRVRRVSDGETIFRTKASVTLLYLKNHSLIYFETEYLFAINSGCGSSGEMLFYGGKDYALEEIYFNKITTVGAYHTEELISIVSSGCSGSEARHTVSEDGFTIRAGENFKVLASEKYRSELNDARSAVNLKISNINR